MKHLLLLIFSFVVTFTMRAQSYPDFTNNLNGVPINYKIIDQTKRYVKIMGAASNDNFNSSELIFPEKVYKQGESEPYTVTEIEHGAFNFIQGSSTGEHLTITLPASLEKLGYYAFAHGFEIKAVDLSKCTKLRTIERLTFHRGNIKKISLPEGLDTIKAQTFDINDIETVYIPSTVRAMHMYSFTYNPNLKFADMSKVSVVPYYDDGVGYGSNTFPFGENADLKIHVNTDMIGLYLNHTVWSNYNGKYYESIDINATGYVSLYLENENFLVPTGCTAYIVTGITPGAGTGLPDQAIVKAFGAGKIIPKQTGFILQGPANTTIKYDAAVTGTEEDVTGNLLVGTGSGSVFTQTGKRFYIFAEGPNGMGFYRQGTRKGLSIKLAAHRAGLCLDESVAPAKGFIIDFDAAREAAETTNINHVNQDTHKKDNVIYDLQGRRVLNPTHGIYIINGKKVVK